MPGLLQLITTLRAGIMKKSKVVLLDFHR